MKYELMLGDCLDRMHEIPDDSVDMVFCDLPYGTTYAGWDEIIPMEELWAHYVRIVRPRGAMLFTAVQPFTTALIGSRPQWFRVDWVWDKVNPANFGNAKKHPLKQHESVVVFGTSPTVYYPQKVAGAANHVQGNRDRIRTADTARIDPAKASDDLSGLKFPKTIQKFPKHSSQCKHHPTEKPVDMISYYIKTYSLPGRVVLDNTMGSGSTGVACANTGRRFIGIEKEKKYFDIAEDRISRAYADALV